MSSQLADFSRIERPVQGAFLPKTDPPLKWAGGKRRLVPRLRALYAPHRARRMVVPFAGGLGDVLGLWPDRALLNDVNPHLINFYQWWRLGLDAAAHPALFQNTAAAFQANKARFNALVQEPGGAQTQEAALLFFYLLRTGFNGLCRFNRAGQYNVGYGKYKAIAYNEWLQGYAVPAAWTFTCGDFSNLAVEADDYIYADPPYDGVFAGYSAGGFGWAQQVALVDWLAAHQGPVVLSNAATPRIERLYQDAGFTLTALAVPRMIACNGDRAHAPEILATRNL